VTDKIAALIGGRTENKTAFYASSFARWAWVPVPVFMLCLLVASALNSSALGSLSPRLLISFYALITASTAGAALVMCARRFARRPSAGVLLLGAGMIIWGSSGVAYMAVSQNAFDPNLFVTVLTISLWEASICWLLGIAWLPHWGAPSKKFWAPWLLGSYAVAALAVWASLFAVTNRLPPVFYQPGTGGTDASLLVILSAAMMLFLTTRLLQLFSLPMRSRFSYLFSLALLLLAVSCLALVLEAVFAGIVAWIGQLALWTAGIYMVLAARVLLRETDEEIEKLNPTGIGEGRYPYSMAVALFVIALGIRLVFLHSLDAAVYLLYFPAVMLAALYGGFRAGMIVTICGVLLGQYAWIHATGNLALRPPDDPALIALFGFIGAMTSWIGHLLRQTDSRLRAAETARREDLERLVAERTSELTREIQVRKEVERALIDALDEAGRSKSELSTILDIAPVAICIARDTSCDVIINNRKAEALFRLPRGGNSSFQQPCHLPCRPVTERLEELPPSMLPVQRAARGESIQGYESCLLYDDGTLRYCYTNAEPLRDDKGNITGSVAAFLDITDIKRFEQNLRRGEERLRLAIEAGGMGAWEWNLITNERIWSDEHYRLLGYEPGTVTPSHEVFAERVLPEDLPQTMAALQQGLRGSREYKVEYRVRGFGDQVHWLEERGHFQFGPDGKAVSVYGVVIDISERKRAEELLRKSQAQLESFVRQAPVSMAMFDRNMNYLAYSHKWLEKNGRGYANLIGKCHYDVHPDLPEAWTDVHRQGMAGRTLSKDADIWTQADGSKIWLHWAVTPWTDEKGQIGGIIIFTEDISERKRMLEDLRASEARFRAAQEASLDAFVIYEPVRVGGKISDLKVIYANKVAADYCRTSRDKMRGHPISAILPGSAQPGNLIEQHAAIIESGNAQEYTLDYKADNVRGYFKNLVVPFGPYVATTFRDVTELRRATEALRESEERSRRLEETLTQGVIYRDREGRVLRVNAAAEAILGHDMGDWAALDFENPKNQCIREDGSRMPRNEMPTFAALHTGKIVSNQVVGVFNPRRKMYRWIIVDSVPLFRDEEEVPYEVYSVFSDITEKVEAARALALAKAEAERANLGKSKFLAAASHDLRQPVQSLALLLSALERHVAKRPQAVKTMDMMKTAVDGLSTLLNGILDISRLDADLVVPTMQNVDVGKLVSFLGREYAPAAAAKNLTLRSTSRSIFAWSDPALVERILRNLIENALRYTGKGGVIIGCRTSGESVRIDVIDTGIGIPNDKQTKIFEEFFQVNSPDHDGEQGMGLGLSIVSRLANLLDAKVHVSSRVGHGSRFSLLLPKAEDSGIVCVETLAASADPGGRILVIEDNAVLREGFVLVLEAWGYGVLSASSGEEALDLAAGEKYNINAIISDYQLGHGLSGIATVRELERRSRQTFPTILITGDTATDNIAETHASGYVVLHKPVRAEDLRLGLAQLLEPKDLTAVGTA
jgi:PAS domain S-box-containing protein